MVNRQRGEKMKTRENKVVVTPHMTRLFCDFCDVEMVKTDTVFMTCPTLYQYKCECCNQVETSRKQYPLIEY